MSWILRQHLGLSFKKVRCIKNKSGRKNDEKVLVLPILSIAYDCPIAGNTF